METIERQPRVIVVTGPESTGKTALCKALSEQLNAEWYPELARGYVESLNRPYTYGDVVKIAKEQIETYNQMLLAGHKLLIFDTGLIITKVWFDVVYGKCPNFIDQHLQKQKVDFHLLCDVDIPWVPDSVRENGGAQRVALFNRYKKELEYYAYPYQVISGLNKARVENAIKVLTTNNII